MAGLDAGVVLSDVLKTHAACPSLAYWLRATAMVPLALAVLFAVRCVGVGGLQQGGCAEGPARGPSLRCSLLVGLASKGGSTAGSRRMAAARPPARPPPPAPSPRRVHLLHKGAAQRAAGYEPHEGDVEWTPASTLLYPALCSFAGVAAGVFGVGGGIIKVGSGGADRGGTEGTRSPALPRYRCTDVGCTGAACVKLTGSRPAPGAPAPGSIVACT